RKLPVLILGVQRYVPYCLLPNSWERKFKNVSGAVNYRRQWVIAGIMKQIKWCVSPHVTPFGPLLYSAPA
ncbi:hypothetical protein, partial [Agriterribacter sp.]|uniref:hypothetical protein n=1 Tax=Agriterribacter sp. TaxID=2821509 RepID=UPI002CDEFC31